MPNPDSTDILSCPVRVTKVHMLRGHKKMSSKSFKSQLRTQTGRKEKYRVLHMEQAAVIHTYTVTQMLGSYTNTVTGTNGHNHKHETHTHDSSQSLAAAHTQCTQAATATKTQGHTLSHLPILAPLPPGYHTQSRRHQHGRHCRQTGLYQVPGEPPPGPA